MNDHAEMAVWLKSSDLPHIHCLHPLRPSLPWFWAKIAERFDARLGLEGLSGIGGSIVSNQSYFHCADVVHLHLIHNDAFFSILSLPRMSHLKPIVWTIHDMWAMTGMCIYSFECEKWLSGCNGQCPHPRGNSMLRHFIPSLHWRIKKRTYDRANLSLVVASQWMHNRVKKSPLLNHFPCRIIPFGIDLQTFAPRSKQESRRRLGLSPDQNFIAFRGSSPSGIQYLYKGVHWLKEALHLYNPSRPTNLLILQDATAFAEFEPKYKVLNCGWLDGEQLVETLCAADLFIMPSIQESFGLMAVEAMACNTPVVVFENTALPEVIHAPNGGMAVPTKDSKALATAITQLLQDDDLRMKLGNQGRQIAENEYSLSLNVKRHVQLYKDIVERHINQ